MRLLVIVLSVLATMALTGCSQLSNIKSNLDESLFGRDAANPPEPLTEFSPTAKSQILWHADVGKSTDFLFTPSVLGDYIYASSAQGELVKIHIKDGRVIWRISVDKSLSSGVGIGGGLLFVGSGEGDIYAIDVDGKLQWKTKLSSTVSAVPQYSNNLLVVRTMDNHIVGLNTSDGSRKWLYQHTTPALTLRSYAGVLVDGGVVYAGFAGGKLVAIRLDNGHLLWEVPFAQPKGVTEVERIAGITSSPVVEDRLLFAVAYQGKVGAVDRLTAQLLWSRDLSSLVGLSTDGGYVYVTHAQDSVYALDYQSGKSFWRQGLLQYRRLTVPLSMGQWVAVGDGEGYVHFLNREDGAIASRIQLNHAAILSQMIRINQDTLVAQTRDGGIFAVQVKP